jgi:hypothetical protein
MIQFGNCLVAFATVACVGCCVAVFRFVLDKWKITDRIETIFKTRKFCRWCFLTWWPCAAWCFIELPMHSLYELLLIPVAAVIATIGYVYLKSQPQ